MKASLRNGLFCLLLLALLAAACRPGSGAPAGLQETADALAATVAARSTADAAGAAAATPTPTQGAIQGGIQQPPATPAGPGLPGTGVDPAYATLSAQLTANPGQPVDPAMATQLAAQGGGLPGGQGLPEIANPMEATTVAFATQLAQQGKPLDPALVTQAAATRAALGPLTPATATAQAVAFAPFLAELPTYGVDPARGYPGWIHPPVTLEADGNDAYSYANEFIQVIAQDFVVSADITWNTKYGDSGCGFVLRSDGNKAAANQYMAVITRGASGHMIFSVMVNGQVASAHDIYARGMDPRFQWQNDTTNRLTVVGRGNTFTVYTNGVKLGDIDPRDPPPQPQFPDPPEEPLSDDPAVLAEFEKAKAEYDTQVARMEAQYNARVKLFKESNVVYPTGLVAMVAATDAGYTRCQFNNAWLWLIQ